MVFIVQHPETSPWAFKAPFWPIPGIFCRGGVQSRHRPPKGWSVMTCCKSQALLSRGLFKVGPNLAWFWCWPSPYIDPWAQPRMRKAWRGAVVSMA